MHDPTAGRANRAVSSGRPRVDELDARRRKLLDTARVLFLAHGYHQVSLATIARDAGVAVRTIYIGFGGKPGLFAAVVDDVHAPFVPQYALLDPLLPVEAALLGFGAACIGFLIDTDFVAIHHIVCAEARYDDALAGVAAQSGLDRVHLELAAYFDDARVRGRLRPDRCSTVVAAHFLACLAGDLLAPPVPGKQASAHTATVSEVAAKRLAPFLRAVLATRAASRASAAVPRLLQPQPAVTS